MGPPSLLPPEEQAKGRYLARLQAAISVPLNTDVNSRRRIAFTFLYTVSTTFPFVVTIASWSFLDPLNFPMGSLSWPKPMLLFLAININVVNSVIALLEIVLLGSVRKQKVIVLQLYEK